MQSSKLLLLALFIWTTTQLGLESKTIPTLQNLADDHSSIFDLIFDMSSIDIKPFLDELSDDFNQSDLGNSPDSISLRKYESILRMVDRILTEPEGVEMDIFDEDISDDNTIYGEDIVYVDGDEEASKEEIIKVLSYLDQIFDEIEPLEELTKDYIDIEIEVEDMDLYLAALGLDEIEIEGFNDKEIVLAESDLSLTHKVKEGLMNYQAFGLGFIVIGIIGMVAIGIKSFRKNENVQDENIQVEDDDYQYIAIGV